MTDLKAPVSRFSILTDNGREDGMKQWLKGREKAGGRRVKGKSRF
jgi:hypothetical protein